MTTISLDPQRLREEAATLALPADLFADEAERRMAEIDGRALRRRLIDRLRMSIGEETALTTIDARDADHLFAQLEAAVRSARFIAVIGAASDQRKAAALAYFQHKHRFNLAQTMSWPDADLALLESRILDQPRAADYRALQDAYDAQYFLADCGGYDAFIQSDGRRLTEVRHHALAALAQPRKGQRLLDLGCGRGELSFALAQNGAHVFGIDYAAPAIAIAERTYAQTKADRLAFQCADALTWKPPHAFDTIVMADVVEHIEPAVLDALFARAAEWLAPQGRILVHTAPNRLHYRFVHRAMRAQALAAGAWLPANPRSFHEDLMHINEQTPKRLERALLRHFPQVCVWAADETDPALTLRLPEGSGWTHAPFLYAAASAAPLDRAALLKLLSQPALALSPSLAVLRMDAPPSRWPAGERRLLKATLRHDGTEAISSFAPTPVHFGIHWFHADGRTAVWDGDRSRLPGRLLPATCFETEIAATAPLQTGRYRLRLAMVQEHVAWHEQALGSHAEFAVEVV